MKCVLCLKAEATKVYKEGHGEGTIDFPVCPPCDERMKDLLKRVKNG